MMLADLPCAGTEDQLAYPYGTRDRDHPIASTRCPATVYGVQTPILKRDFGRIHLTGGSPEKVESGFLKAARGTDGVCQVVT